MDVPGWGPVKSCAGVHDSQAVIHPSLLMSLHHKTWSWRLDVTGEGESSPVPPAGSTVTQRDAARQGWQRYNEGPVLGKTLTPHELGVPRHIPNNASVRNSLQYFIQRKMKCGHSAARGRGHLTLAPPFKPPSLTAIASPG